MKLNHKEETMDITEAKIREIIRDEVRKIQFSDKAALNDASRFFNEELKKFLILKQKTQNTRS